MKGMDIWCASQASTAICTSMDQLASSSSSTIHLGSSRVIDRHNPIIRDARRAPIALSPCTSQLPISPKPHNQKTRKSKPSDDSSKQKFAKQNEQTNRNRSATSTDFIRKSCVKPADLFTPPGSTRYLLSENGFFEGLPDSEPGLAMVPVENKKIQALKMDESSSCSKDGSISQALDRSSSSRCSISDKISSLGHSSLSQSSHKSSSSSSGSNSDQVVVLRVSLHCKGCAGKVRKHISRMEGVTSFNIDFAAKKVTITGDVTPLGVLASISKVKNAQLWTPEKPKLSHPSSVGSN